MSFIDSSSRPSLVPSIPRREVSLLGRILSAIRSQWPDRTRGSPPETDHLRRDIGLLPLQETRRNHWDYR